MPITAALLADPTRVRIEFDKALVNQPATLANWSVVVMPGPVTLVPIAVDFTAATRIRLTFAGAVSGAVSVTYLASPPDVVGQPPYPFAVQPFTISVS